MLAQKIKINQNGWRARLILAGLLLFCAAVLGRIYYLQVVMGEYYQVLAQGMRPFSRNIDLPDRGEIFFAGGQPLAINKDFAYAYAEPAKIKDKAAAAKIAAEILELEESALAEKFNKNSLYATLKERIDDQKEAAIKEARVEGFYAARRKMRYYPQGTVAAQLAGFVDGDGKGRYGLEEYYDNELARGQNIVLNIDYNIQYQAEKILAAAAVKLNAQQGEVIVADPKTGAILAMAKTPNFDPNQYREYAKENIDIFKNDSCQTLFEPGSVFKAITMASALNDGKVTPQTGYQDVGSLTVGPDTIYNYSHRSYGWQTMTNVLEHSVNTGAAFAQRQLGNKSFADYIDKFGVFEKTGIDLPETFSSNSEFKKGYAINYVTASYGQGIWMTSIQLIRAYSALANGGRLVRPAVAREIGQADGDSKNQPQVISSETSATISKMLASVVDNGFGKSAKVPGYTISGKTGTAQMSWSVLGINRHGYSDKTTQSFIGFFPGDDPKFLILTKLKSPDVNTAEYSAIPVFNELAKYVIYATQLPPNEEIKTAPAAPSSTTLSAVVSPAPAAESAITAAATTTATDAPAIIN